MNTLNKIILLIGLIIIMLNGCSDSGSQFVGRWTLTETVENNSGKITDLRQKRLLLEIHNDGSFREFGVTRGTRQPDQKWRTKIGGGIELIYIIPSLEIQHSTVGYLEGDKLIFKSDKIATIYKRTN